MIRYAMFRWFCMFSVCQRKWFVATLAEAYVGWLRQYRIWHPNTRAVDRNGSSGGVTQLWVVVSCFQELAFFQSTSLYIIVTQLLAGFRSLAGWRWRLPASICDWSSAQWRSLWHLAGLHRRISKDLLKLRWERGKVDRFRFQTYHCPVTKEKIR